MKDKQQKYHKMIEQLQTLRVKAKQSPRKSVTAVNELSIRQRINELIKKRKIHQSRINELIKNPNELPLYQIRQFSHISQVQRNVNFLASMFLKQNIPQKQPMQPNFICSSHLQKAYPQYKIMINFDIPTPAVLFQTPIAKIIQYLDENQLWKDLFKQYWFQNDVSYQSKYYKNGQLLKVCLTNKSLQQDQLSYITVYQNEGIQYLNPKYFLLKRLIDNSHTFPFILTKLFGYPHKIYDLHSTLSYLKLKNDLKQHHSCYGKKQQLIQIIDNRYLNDQMRSFNQMKKILNKYDEIILLDSRKLQSKCIDLICLINHYVVLSLTVSTDQEQIDCTLTIFCPTAQRFKVCLVDSAQNIVYHSIQSIENSFSLSLPSDEYQLFVSPCANNPSPLPTTSFRLQAQGTYVSECLQFEIKLKERFNQYTKFLIDVFLRDNYSYFEVQSQQPIKITRIVTGCVELCLDIVRCSSAIAHLTLTYAHSSALCDQHHASNIISLPFKGVPENVYLSWDAPIEKVEVNKVPYVYKLNKIYI